MTLRHDPDISQVTYFKPTGSMQGLFVENAAADTLVQATFYSGDPEGTLHAGCVNASTQIPASIPLNATNESTVEPFTQTRYNTLFDSTIPADCERYAIYGNFTSPWAAVVGKKESFGAVELLMFPVYSAKLHGSWWNDNYVYEWPFIVALAIGLCFGLRAFVVALFVASAANRFAHAWTFVAIVDLIPAFLIAYDRRVLWWIFVVLVAVSVAILSSWWLAAIIATCGLFFPRFGRGLTLLFAVGSGYFMGPVFYIVDLCREYYICGGRSAKKRKNSQ